MATNLTAERRRIDREIEKLRKQQEALLAKARKPVIAQIVADMREFGISPEEVSEAVAKGAKRGRPAAGSSQPKKTAAKGRKRALVPPKYRNPKTGETWTGRGRAPRWVVDAEEAGINRSEFEIAPEKAEPAQPQQSADTTEEKENSPITPVSDD